MRNKFGLDFLRPGSGRVKLIFAALLCLILSSASPAVNSKVTRHNSSSDLIKGKKIQYMVSCPFWAYHIYINYINNN